MYWFAKPSNLKISLGLRDYPRENSWVLLIVEKARDCAISKPNFAMMEGGGVNHGQPQSGQSRRKVCFATITTCAAFAWPHFWPVSADPVLMQIISSYWNMSYWNICYPFPIYVIQCFPTYLCSISVFWYCFWESESYKNLSPPYIHVSCQSMCVQEGVSDILATPVKGWKMKNTQRYNRTESSIYMIVNENKYLKQESKLNFEFKPKQLNPLSKPF